MSGDYTVEDADLARRILERLGESTEGECYRLAWVAEEVAKVRDKDRAEVAARVEAAEVTGMRTAQAICDGMAKSYADKDGKEEKVDYLRRFGAEDCGTAIDRALRARAAATQGGV